MEGNAMVPQPYPFIIKKAVDAGFLQHVLEIIEQQTANFSKNNASSNRQFLKMDYVTPEGDAYLFDTKTVAGQDIRSRRLHPRSEIAGFHRSTSPRAAPSTNIPTPTSRGPGMSGSTCW